MMACAKGIPSDELKCPICRDILDQPILIPCSHTFCRSCLAHLHRIQASGDRMQCPVCRASCDVADGDVSHFPTNLIAKSLAEDFVKARSARAKAVSLEDGTFCDQKCTVCDNSDADPATVYCQKCAEFLCDLCLSHHGRYKRNASHETVGVTDILSGKVAKKWACREHPEELEQWVCITCLAYVCAVCCEITHMGEGHNILSIQEWENNHTATVEMLEERAQNKLLDLEDYGRVVETEIENVKSVVEQRKREIESAYEELEQKLAQRKAALLDECTNYQTTLCDELQSIAASNEVVFSNIIQKIYLIVENSSALRDRQSVQQKTERCSELENVLEGNFHNQDTPRSVAQRAHHLTFHPWGEPNTPQIGSIHITEWEHKRRVDIGIRDSLCFMTATHDNRMVVGTRHGSIETFHADGEREETCNKCPGARGLGVLTDGRYVIRDNNNSVYLCTQQFQKLDTGFESLSKNDGGVGGLAIGRNDRIYVDYRIGRKVQVFTPEGGKPVKEIPCDGYEPWQVFVMNSNDALLVLSHSNSVRIVDESGQMKHVITKGVDAHVFPAICRDGCVLLACLDLKDSQLCIEKYTSELQYKETLVSNYHVEVASRKWYYLQEFTNGEIAFCTPDRLFIFGKITS